MLKRVLEPEVMDTADEARDYNAMDHSEVNVHFCDDLLASGEIGETVLDVGTGTALIPIELCMRREDIRVVAVDLAEQMLVLGQHNVARAGLQDRVMLEKIDAKAMPYDDASFATTVSNSIIHHIPDPRVAFAEMMRVTARGGLLFVRDLARPSTDAAVDDIVKLYVGTAPDDPAQRLSHDHQRELFRASLKAALTVEEVSAMLEALGMEKSGVRMTSDRHWTLSFRKP